MAQSAQALMTSQTWLIPRRGNCTRIVSIIAVLVIMNIVLEIVVKMNTANPVRQDTIVSLNSTIQKREFLLSHLNGLMMSKVSSRPLPQDVMTDIFTNFKTNNQNFGERKASYDRPYLHLDTYVQHLNFLKPVQRAVDKSRRLDDKAGTKKETYKRYKLLQMFYCS